MSNIKYVGKGPDKGKIHATKGDGKNTACGEDYSDNPWDWEATSERVTCDKNGCSDK